MKAYLVGGWVRDQVLRKPGRDRDWIVVGATPEEMAARGFLRVGRDFPVFLHPVTREEYALARSSGSGGPRFGPEVTLEQDLRHRDFTINAMALDEAGSLCDPTGGARDLDARILRHIGNGLTDDPLRILRAARFLAQWEGFTLAPETRAEMERLATTGALAGLPPERIGAELEKALSAANPSAFFLTLRTVGALAPLFPEIDRLFGVPQRADHHPEIDTGTHTMMALTVAARLTPSTAIRFAALVHDLGKGTTPADLLPRHHGHEGRGAPLVETLVARYAGPNLHRDLGKAAARLHGLLHKIAELRPGTVLEVLEAADAFHRPERLDALLIVAEADSRGRRDREEAPYPQAALWRRALTAAAAISARALIAEGRSPGPGLAALLRERRTEAIRRRQ